MRRKQTANTKCHQASPGQALCKEPLPSGHSMAWRAPAAAFPPFLSDRSRGPSPSLPLPREGWIAERRVDRVAAVRRSAVKRSNSSNPDVACYGYTPLTTDFFYQSALDPPKQYQYTTGLTNCGKDMAYCVKTGSRPSTSTSTTTTSNPIVGRIGGPSPAPGTLSSAAFIVRSGPRVPATTAWAML